jgi:hypothetical protein
MFFCSDGEYIVALIGNVLWYAGVVGTNANWVQANSHFPGAMPIKEMIMYGGGGVIMADGNGVFWHCGIPGSWVQDIPQTQPTSTFKQFLGSTWDGNIDNPSYYISALDTANPPNTWLIGNPTAGGGWVPAPSLAVPR